MGISGAADNLSEGSKKALQSETWQAVREVKHFTEEPTAGVDNAYGWTWNQVVNEYLRSGYHAADSSTDIVVMGKTYKTLKRPEVTVFYDAAGNTLFDVTNERLEKEYEWLMDNPKEDDNVIPMGKTSLKEIITGLPAPTVEEIETAKEENAKPVKQRAKEKLKMEMEAAEDKSFAEPVIGYLLERCNEDEGLAEDVVQEHKTWQKCLNYIYDQAKRQVKGRCAVVRNDVVYEWAEDYYRKDDKAEEQEKAKKLAEAKAWREKEAAEKKNTKAAGTGKIDKAPVPKKAEAPKETSNPKRNGKDIDGQLDMFSIMGM